MQAFVDHQPYECTFRILRPDGSIRVIKSIARVVFDHDDRPVRMFGSVQDISEQCHAEQLIRDSEERFARFAIRQLSASRKSI